MYVLLEEMGTELQRGLRCRSARRALRLADCAVVGPSVSSWSECQLSLLCVSDNAIEAIDEFAFLEGEFSIFSELVMQVQTLRNVCLILPCLFLG